LWAADPSQPGYGNFCFGHRAVTSIDNVTTASSQNGAVTTASVSYHYDLSGVPDWAKNAEIQTAFPSVKADLAGSKSATANLTQTQNGWQLAK
jgi:hypothetical protein